MDLKTLLKAQWDRSTAVACTALGAVLLLVGWIGVSGTPFLAEQAPYILSGGVGGVFLLGVGSTLWISADLRDEWRKLDRIEAALLDRTLRFVDEDEPVAEVPVQRSLARFSTEVDEDDTVEVRVEEIAPARRRLSRAQQEDALASSRESARAARTATTRGTAASTAAVRPKRSRAGVGHA